ncbi:Cys/Met metabolism PLP-dependent enzyme [Rhizoctonia solani]|uniref:Cys/Met metabolism PLP-dependent enzyme n=1 Tax=Rhizoctonia solani TaxID=456999 RepID=A0A8H8NNG2_9AGAM|nr:Cys/Met metabolism PLP-dependent enzyme [Rhizoctonia solani]QRW16400.1 Cys/Met metabolism PLP-dependent enzyme [Rhizoctonia solani]
MSQNLELATRLLHADDEAHSEVNVAPAISVSTTFRAPGPVKLEYPDEPDVTSPQRHIYSRYTTPISTRVEKVLSALLGGHAITYASGIAATYSALVHLNPKRLAIRDGYHGVHVSIDVYKKAKPELEIIDIDDEFKAGDLCWVETPLNPTGEARNLKYYAEKVHAVGGRLIVDSTFAPPPIQDPFAWGADVVLHSGYELQGPNISEVIRIYYVECLRTLELRATRQAENGAALAQWLHRVSQTPAGQSWDGVRGGSIKHVWHATLQGQKDQGWIKKQMPGGGPACFSFMLDDPNEARVLPYMLKLFTPATSLGGVESLIEQRYLSDAGADKRLIRLSVGLENLEDLKEDLRQALNGVPAKVKARL